MSDSEDCELGRREYWDSTYERELLNLQMHGDEGEIWFGADVMHTMVQWMHTLLLQHSLSATSASILDVGTGNALLPLELAKLGYTDLTGSDYSPQSIALARQLTKRHSQGHIRLMVDDLLHTCLHSRFDVITDKGTLDAVGLMADADENRAKYQQSVWSLLNPGGLLIITSCNSTQEELCKEFCQSTQDSLAAIVSGSEKQQVELPPTKPFMFQHIDHVRTYPKFKFAGVEGTKVCTVAFMRLQ